MILSGHRTLTFFLVTFTGYMPVDLRDPFVASQT
jgi:hypothetical protein